MTYAGPGPLYNPESMSKERTPAVGSRCLAGPGRRCWSPGTVARVNHDGTYTVKSDEPHPALPFWYGLCADEISFEDISVEELRERFRDAPPPPFYKLYWNLVRMGGRSPEELDMETLTLNDTFNALAVDASCVSEERLDVLEDAEQEAGFHYPEALRSFWTRADIREAVKRCHPNNAELVFVADQDFELDRNPGGPELDGAVGATVLSHPYSGFEWLAAFRPGDRNTRIYLVEFDDDEDEDAEPDKLLHLVAPSLEFFFWDLAQTGRAWHEHVNEMTYGSL